MSKRKHIIVAKQLGTKFRSEADLGTVYKLCPQDKDKSIIMKKHRALVLHLKAHKFCRKQAWDRARAEHRRRAKALAKTKAKQTRSGSRSGQTRAPCQGAGKEQRESTQANYGCSAQA